MQEIYHCRFCVFLGFSPGSGLPPVFSCQLQRSLCGTPRSNEKGEFVEEGTGGPIEVLHLVFLGPINNFPPVVQWAAVGLPNLLAMCGHGKLLVRVRLENEHLGIHQKECKLFCPPGTSTWISYLKVVLPWPNERSPGGFGHLKKLLGVTELVPNLPRK